MAFHKTMYILVVILVPIIYSTAETTEMVLKESGEHCQKSNECSSGRCVPDFTHVMPINLDFEGIIHHQIIRKCAVCTMNSQCQKNQYCSKFKCHNHSKPTTTEPTTTAEPTTGIHHYTNSTATSKRDHDSTSLPTVVWSTNTSTNLVTDGTAGPSTPIPTTADLITVSPTTIDVTPAAPTKASTAASPTTVQLITPAPTVAATTTRTSTTNTPGNIWSTTTQSSYIFY